jgi:hypothetical protein
MDFRRISNFMVISLEAADLLPIADGRADGRAEKHGGFKSHLFLGTRQQGMNIHVVGGFGTCHSFIFGLICNFKPRRRRQ